MRLDINFGAPKKNTPSKKKTIKKDEPDKLDVFMPSAYDSAIEVIAERQLEKKREDAILKGDNFEATRNDDIVAIGKLKPEELAEVTDVGGFRIVKQSDTSIILMELGMVKKYYTWSKSRERWENRFVTSDTLDNGRK